MPPCLLEKTEIKESTNNVCDVFSFLADFKKEKPLAEHISSSQKHQQFFSESIIWHLTVEKRIETVKDIRNLYFGGQTADIIIEDTNGKTFKVEAKLT